MPQLINSNGVTTGGTLSLLVVLDLTVLGRLVMDLATLVVAAAAAAESVVPARLFLCLSLAVLDVAPELSFCMGAAAAAAAAAFGVARFFLLARSPFSSATMLFALTRFRLA
jgi:hypothetical protein